jgi:hypothetical protein
VGDTSGLQGLALVAPYGALCLVIVVVACVALWVLRRPIIGWLAELTSSGDAPDGAIALSVLSALGILSFFASIEILATALFVAGQGVSAVLVLAASFVAGLLVFAACRRLVVQSRVKVAFPLVMAVCMLVTLMALVIASHFYDVSWDGQWIHQQAAVVIANGWNPVADPLGYTAHAGVWHPDLGDVTWKAGIENFSKGIWIRTGTLYAFTRNIETSKAGNIVLLFATFIVWLALALRLTRGRWRLSALLAVLVTLNPISVVQLLSHKNDGQLGSLLAIAVGLGCLAATGSGGWPAVVALCCATLMLCTIKFTGLVYAGVLVAGLALALGALGRFRSRAALLLALAGTLAVATLAVGYNPYVVNTVRYGHPFYPLMGRGAVDTLTNQSPVDFRGKSNAERLFRSLFSRAEDERLGGAEPVPTRLKVPFVVYASELRPYLGFDTRIAGFGPLFSGALVLGMIALVLLAWRWARRRERWLGAGLLLIVALTASALSNPAAWWARYVPQIWLLPVVVAGLALCSWRTGPGRWLATGLVVVLVVDTALVGTINFANVVHGTREITASLDRAAAWPGGVEVSPGLFSTSWTKLDERGIRWRFARDGGSARSHIVVPYTTMTLYPLDDPRGADASQRWKAERLGRRTYPGGHR